MKKLISLLLVMAMLVSLCACGADSSGKKDKGDTPGSTAGESTDPANPTGSGAESSEGTKPSGTEPSKTEGTKTPTANKGPSASKAPVEEDDDWEDDFEDDWEKPEEPEKPDNRPKLKILSIGHSFSVDAMRTYMWDLFDAAGYNVTIAYLYFPGCSLERQYHYITQNVAKYHRYAKNSGDGWDEKSALQIDNKTNEVISGGVRALDALWDEDWDIVTFQPSPDYGKGTMTYDCKWGCGKPVNDYQHFAELVKYVRETLADEKNPNGPNTDVKFYYHLTWAFSTDCELWSYMYSNFNQMQMYNDFINATLTHITSKGIIPEENIIPCITSVQNARTSWMGDSFNEPGGKDRDGYHLNDKGDLVAAMTWVSYFTGVKASSYKIGTRYSDDEYAAIAEAVDNAIANPLQVTQSSYKTEP